MYDSGMDWWCNKVSLLLLYSPDEELNMTLLASELRCSVLTHCFGSQVIIIASSFILGAFYTHWIADFGAQHELTELTPFGANCLALQVSCGAPTSRRRH